LISLLGAAPIAWRRHQSLTPDCLFCSVHILRRVLALVGCDSNPLVRSEGRFRHCRRIYVCPRNLPHHLVLGHHIPTVSVVQVP
jgi:hypothetical protein